MTDLEKLEYRIYEISYKYQLSHLGSCISAVSVIKQVYDEKKPEDIFILSCGHAGLALYCVLEQVYGHDAEKLFIKHGVHPCRDTDNHISLSTGSLGMVLPIAVGMALADTSRDVHVLISDGECAEGSIWEALRFIKTHNVTNLKLYVNINGYGAYSKIDDADDLMHKIESYVPHSLYHGTVNYIAPFLNGLDAHYYVMIKEDWEWVKNAYES
jgi:transketolase